MNIKKEDRIRFAGCVFILIVTVACFLFRAFYNGRKSPYFYPDPAYDDGRPYIDVQLLTPNPYSRPCIATDTITSIVIHYVGNPGSTAQGLSLIHI